MVSVSPENSLKGYDVSIWANSLLEIRKWIGSTKNSLKTLLVALVTVEMVYFNPWALSTFGEVTAGVLSAALAKWLTDGVDFWLSRVEL